MPEGWPCWKNRLSCLCLTRMRDRGINRTKHELSKRTDVTSMVSTGTHLSPGAALRNLRQTVARIDAAHALAAPEDRGLVLGLPGIDHVLGGGLARGAIHEIVPTAALHLGAATGFTLALAMLAGTQRSAVWIQTDFAAAEVGAPYGP